MIVTIPALCIVLSTYASVYAQYYLFIISGLIILASSIAYEVTKSFSVAIHLTTLFHIMPAVLQIFWGVFYYIIKDRYVAVVDALLSLFIPFFIIAIIHNILVRVTRKKRQAR